MLKELYKAAGVPDKEQVSLSKNVLLVVPEKGYDVMPVVSSLGLARCEVAVTWPKQGLDMVAEVDEIGPSLILQVGNKVWDELPFVQHGEDVGDELRAKAAEATADAFVGLHHHDEFSIKDGLGTMDGLVKLLKAQRRSFCCVTNHGSVGGWIRQYNACRKAGIKAIFGMEVYVSNYRGDDMEQKKAHRSANHLVLLARTKEGFDNIIRIHNDAQLNGFYYTPRTTWESLEKWGKGIIGMSACMAGEIPQALLADDMDGAKQLVEFYSSVFDQFYVELQVIEFEQQREANRRLIRLAQEVGAPMVISCDSHYLESEHADTHDLLMCIRQGKTVLDRADDKEDVWSFDVRNLYYRNADQMWDAFAGGFVEKDGTQRAPFMDDVFTQEVFLDAMAMTRAIAMSTDEIVLDSSIKLPKLYDDGKSVLRQKVNAGFTAKGFGKREDKDKYFERVKSEFGVITKLGWTDYFLIMEKIISETKAKFGEWAVGYGRGSAAGSLVSYCLGLTDVDPIEYGLLFERFLDEGRPDPPDIDTDFDPRVRDWVKKRIVESFGEDNVCSIGTYGTYRTRAVILDVARVLALDLGEAANVTKRIDPLKSFEDDEGEDTKVDKLDFDELCGHYPELKAYFEAHPEVRHHAEILRNQVKNMGTHAGGVIISDASLKDRIPVLWDKAASEERQVISAWAESGTASELSSVGLVKYDILGLNNLPVISDCVGLIEKTRGKKIRRRDIPINDGESIRLCSKGDLVGIFQLENPSMKGVMDEVRMESLEDVAAVTSLIRPGPMDAVIDGEKVPLVYAHRKHGQPYVSHPLLKDVLGPTYGLLVYQEQVMAISRVLAGFTAPEANKLRKAMGKKIKELMAEMKVKFLKGAQAKIDAGEITAEEIEDIFSQMETFASYGFNKSHAVCYSAISTVELWLKYHYPVEFCTALINNTKLGKKKHGSEDVLVDYVNYARKKGHTVMGPDVNSSEEEFTIQAGAILFSIGHVKNVASSAATIVANRPYASMEDFYNRVKVETHGESGKVLSRRPNRKVVESLIAAGAFDAFGTRNEVLAEYYRLRKEKVAAPERTDDEWVELEKEMIGLCLSRPPLYRQHEALIRQKGWKLVSEIDAGKRIMVFGRVESVRSHLSKAGNQMYLVQFSDGLDEMTFMVFTGAQQFRDALKVGSVAAVPLDRFEDGGNRFFDERGKVEVISK